jgi:hypothetical protein
MPTDTKNISPAQRAHFLDFLQMLGGQPAAIAGLEVLAQLDAGKPLPVVSLAQPGITIQIPPQLLTQLPADALAFGAQAGEIWKWLLKLLECGLKNIALAIQGKWLEFATAVLKCVFG